MDTHTCPKCKHAMDQGRISVTSSNSLVYLSNSQTGMLRQPTQINAGWACPNCGYVEMYLDPAELKKRLK